MNEIKNTNEPFKVAVVIGKFVAAGTKSYVMNYYNNIDIKKVHMDFIIDDTSPITEYHDIESRGSRVYRIPTVKHPVRHMKQMIKILKEGKYSCVHSFKNSLNVFTMCAAKAAGIPIRISHNLSTAHPGERKTIIKNILRPFSTLFVTHMAANSLLAAEWMFGKKNLDECTIFHNAIDLEKYKYDEELRNTTRKKLGLENSFVIGHIGRYEYQKNHEFLIDIFNALYKKDKSAKLLLVGYGSLKEKIWSKIEKLGLREAVIDAGATEDIIPFYNAMDCFVLPSFYEGLPVVGIEAQATGLPCILSTEITRETKITDNVQFISLNESADLWAEKILEYKNCVHQNNTKMLTSNGYDIKKEVNKLMRYYKSMENSYYART